MLHNATNTSHVILILSFCVYVSSTYFLILPIFFFWPHFNFNTIFFFWPHFNFNTLFGLFVLLFTLREAFKLEPVKREAALLVHIRPYFIYFYFSLTGYLFFRRVVRNDSLVR